MEKFAVSDTGAYILGILWACCGPGDKTHWWVRHRDPWYPEAIRTYLSITARVHKSFSNTGSQARLKIARIADMNKVKQLLYLHGWTPRQSKERLYPSGPLNDRGFIRAWIEIHSHADIARTGRKRKPTPRLRVYGNKLLLEEMNLIIAGRANVQPRTLQRTGNEITKALYYTGRNFRAVLEWLYDMAELYNPDTKAKLLNIASQGHRP